MDTEFLKIFNKISATLSIISTTLTSFFGIEWILFLGYLILNILDYVTGTIKSKVTHTESCKKSLLLDSNTNCFFDFLFVDANWFKIKY